MKDGDKIETTTGRVTIRIRSSYSAVSAAFDKAKEIRAKNGTWFEGEPELWLWPNDPRFKK